MQVPETTSLPTHAHAHTHTHTHSSSGHELAPLAKLGCCIFSHKKVHQNPSGISNDRIRETKHKRGIKKRAQRPSPSQQTDQPGKERTEMTRHDLTEQTTQHVTDI